MNHKRVLIIDDEEAIQTIVRFGLQMSGNWDVLTANSGLEGIACAKVEKPDIVLLDVMMPDMDGLATFQQLRQQEETKTIPVILLTAKAQAAEKCAFQKIGVDGIITKPFNSLDLAKDINQILGYA